MRLSKHVYYYRDEWIIPLNGMMTGNTCVIRGGGGELTMTDPGPAIGPHLDIVKFRMRLDGLRFDDVSAFIVTHMHPDHAQIAPRLAREMDATLYAHELERSVIENPDEIWYDEERLPGAFRDRIMAVSPGMIDRICSVCFGKAETPAEWTPLKDGQTLDLGVEAQVILFGGHRPGEIALYLPADRVLLTGDTMNKWRGGIPSLNFPSSDMTTALAALRRIQHLDIDIIVNGHNPPTKGARRIKRWIRKSIKRAEGMQRRADAIITLRPDISLLELGFLLIQPDPGIYKIELRSTAFATLKSTEKGREWIRRRSAPRDEKSSSTV